MEQANVIFLTHCFHCCVLQMEPLFGDQDFLEEQHILVSVIAKDGDESYGKSTVPLFSDDAG